MIFPYLKAKKEELGYPSSKNELELVIAPHNLANNFQSLDIIVNQKAKKLVSHKFNTWHGDPFSDQLKCDVAPGNVTLSLKMSDMKLLHARCIVEM